MVISFAGHQSPFPPITHSTSTSNNFMVPPYLLKVLVRVGPASILPALPGDQSCLLACFPNKLLPAPSLLTCLCPGKASHKSSPDLFFPLCCWGAQTKISHLLSPSCEPASLNFLVFPISLGAGTRAVAWLPALGEVHPWKEPCLIVLCLSRTQHHPRGSACRRSIWSKISSCTPDTRYGPSGTQGMAPRIPKANKAFYYYI